MPNMTSDAPMIEARDIRKAFGANQVLRGVSLQLRQGEVVAVIGPSGSGKSTFLRCLNHLETIDSGHIAIEGETLVTTDAQGRCVYAPDAELRRICRKTGMVFQHFNLFGHLTVLENLIEAPMVVQGLSREAAIARAERLLAKVGLSDKQGNYPRAPVGWAKAARGHRARAVHGARHHAVRRAHLGARPRAHRRGAAHHARAGR